MKNKSFAALVAVIVVQVVAFIGMAGYSVKSYDDIMNSMEYKMAVKPTIAYDNVIEFNTRTRNYYHYVDATNEGYITISFEENGMAYFYERVEEKPEGNFYVKPNRKNNKRFRSYEIKGVDREQSLNFYEIDYEEAYITFKVNKGEATITGLYIDNVPAEEWIKNPIVKPNQENEFDVLNDDAVLGDESVL